MKEARRTRNLTGVAQIYSAQEDKNHTVLQRGQCREEMLRDHSSRGHKIIP